MLTPLVVFVRSLALICAGHRAVALENVALRQQLAVFTRTSKRPYSVLEIACFGWPSPTCGGTGVRRLSSSSQTPFVRWHRQWLRRRWTWRSAHARVGRPGTATIRQLVVEDTGGPTLAAVYAKAAELVVQIVTEAVRHADTVRRGIEAAGDSTLKNADPEVIVSNAGGRDLTSTPIE